MKRLILLIALLLISASAVAAGQTVTLPCGSGATQLASGLTGLTYTDTTPVDGAIYNYVVTAVTLGGQTCSNIVFNVTIPATGAHTVTLNWFGSTTSGAAYSVFRETPTPPNPPSGLTDTVN